jgi:hypothetical protein
MAFKPPYVVWRRPTVPAANKEATMIGYFVSLLMGLPVGVAYGLVQVRSRPRR